MINVTEIAQTAVKAPAYVRPGLTAFAATLAAFAAVARHGFGSRGLLDAAVCAVLVVLAAVDLERRIIPNRIVLPAAALTLAAQVGIHPSRWYWYTAAALGAGLVFLAFYLFFRGGLGMGDVKLAVFIGAALGKSVVAGLALGSLAGGLVALYLLATRGAEARRMSIAYGPCLAAGAILVLLG
jgi:leader peptidase (prepilin peptidase) / N-methyltransferase